MAEKSVINLAKSDLLSWVSAQTGSKKEDELVCVAFFVVPDLKLIQRIYKLFMDGCDKWKRKAAGYKHEVAGFRVKYF